MLGGALEFSDILHVRRAAGRDHRGIEPVRAHAGQRLVVEFLRLGPAGLGRVQHEAAEFQPLRGRDLARQRDGLGRRLDAGALAPGVAFDHDRERPAGCCRRLRQARDHDRIVGGDRHVGLGLQRAEPRHLLVADQIVADQDVVDPGIRHHLGLADLLAGDALGAGRDLHLREHRALVGLDMRPVGDAGGIAGRLDARDVALDPVHVDHGGGRAVFAGDFGGEGRGHAIRCAIARVRMPSLSISSRSTSSSSHLSSASASSFCAVVSAAEAASNFLRSFL